jgi:hypothetical protein
MHMESPSDMTSSSEDESRFVYLRDSALAFVTAWKAQSTLSAEIAREHCIRDDHIAQCVYGLWYATTLKAKDI